MTQQNDTAIPTSAQEAPQTLELTSEQTKVVTDLYPILRVPLNNPRLHSDLGTQLPINFDRMQQISNELIALCKQKDAEYGSSWRKRGGPGAFFTMTRKLDRLEEQMRKVDGNIFAITHDPAATESIDETIRDAINYLLLIQAMRDAIAAELAQMDVQQKAAGKEVADRIKSGDLKLPGVVKTLAEDAQGHTIEEEVPPPSSDEIRSIESTDTETEIQSVEEVPADQTQVH